MVLAGRPVGPVVDRCAQQRDPAATGIHVRSISNGIDPETSTGRLMLNMLATLAEYERKLIIERVNAGIAAAAQNGTRSGRPLSDPAVIANALPPPAGPRCTQEQPL